MTRRSTSTTILILLVIAIGINYVDRGSLPVVKTDVASEYQLDNAQVGLLFSAFFWSYACSQLAAGWLVDRFDVKWLYAAGFLLWSAATILMGFSTGFAMFLVLRLILGVGESVAFPATSRMLVLNFQEHRLGLANALIDAASKLGPAVSILFGGWIATQFGWRALFLVVGIGGLFWLPAWFLLVPSQEKKQETEPGSHVATAPRVGFSALLSRREVWGTSLGFFCLGYVWAFLVSWLPAYLEESRGFSKQAMFLLGSLPFFSMAVASIFGGWLADRWIGLGGTSTRVRKNFLIFGLSVSAVCLAAAALVTNAAACVACLCLACGALGIYTANAWAVTQTLAGPAAAGQWSGLQNAIGNFGAALSAAVTGWLVKEQGAYTSSFLLSSFTLSVGALSYLLLIRKIAPLEWHAVPAASRRSRSLNRAGRPD